MIKNLLLFAFLSASYGLSAQNWSDDVAEIFYNKCTKCHHSGGVGPFELMTYADASPMATAIFDAVLQEEMPPWPPNNDYQTYAHDRSLTPTEKTTVLDWINGGALEGTPANTPPPPVYLTGAILGNGDLEMQIPTYMSKALSNGDDYVCFAMPSNLPTNRTIRAVEIVPGNPEIVHHALIYLDPTSSSITDTVGGDCAGPSSLASTLVMGYTPGSTPMVLPSASPLKLGIPMPANSQVIFAMHYPEGSYGQYDSTKVIFHFYPPGEPSVREVYTSRVLEDWSFSLPPNQLTSLSTQYPASGGLITDYSLLSVFPHMHLLGRDMLVYGILPNNDTLKLIDIPHWDFEWQDFYFYSNIKKAGIGTTLYADATFDNTSGNLHNPNNPPITVAAGLNTSDEMFLVYMHYMAYQAGDENYDMDSLMNLGTASILNDPLDDKVFSIYPNPFDNGVHLYSDELTQGDQVSIVIYNNQGQLIKHLANDLKLEGNELHLEWDGNNDAGDATSPGLYFVSLNINGAFSHQRVIKR
ncbi:MAG: T9SS type A sorting domain-containing protein [Crocinitomicaceae bacterium]|nr:T9SS type A sorting domain-containing protein [Crocinitomicaceae bacterium]